MSKIKVHSLTGRITPELMRQAFLAVKRNRGAAGVDKVSIRMFAANLDENLAALMRDLKSRTFRPRPLRRVHIPKGPGSTKTRPLGIPADLVNRTRLLFDLTHLALETDSTRLITILLLGTSLVPPIPGISDGHHNLSHHGQDPEKLRQLKIVELETMRLLRDLLVKLQQSREGGASLLDQTMVLFGSNLGNASSHSCKNLPMILAGGGFQHGQYLSFAPEKSPPLANLFVTMLQRLGIETDKFGSSTGTLTGLETAG